MSILRQPRSCPSVILFDWHGTLVDTHDAMYHAVADVLPRLGELGLLSHLQAPEACRTLEEASLIKCVREQGALLPEVVAEKRLSRTDIFELLFGADEVAKSAAHAAFDEHYRRYVSSAQPLEADAHASLKELVELGLVLGVISNRRLEYLRHELELVDGGRWLSLLSLVMSGSEVARRKPSPDVILGALARLQIKPDTACWYVGDSTADVVAGAGAGVTSVFYNGRNLDEEHLDRLFPGSARCPEMPDLVVGNLHELVAKVRLFMAQQLRVERSRGNAT